MSARPRITLQEQQARKLRAIAEEEGVSLNSLVRDAVDMLLLSRDARHTF